MPGSGLFRGSAYFGHLDLGRGKVSRHSLAVFSERLASKENTDGAGF